jgi:tRNA threonylcarbamoyladenosine biosynthesis protein TsaB
MRVLGIETSGGTGGFAVVEDGRLVAEAMSDITGHHLEKGTAMMEGVLERAGVARGGLSHGGLGAVAVSLGPGSFTGLRVGLALAKGLCFGRAIPLVGVPTLDCIAEAFLPRQGLIVPVKDARRGEIYFSIYRADRTEMQRLCDYVALPPDGVAREVAAALEQAVAGFCAPAVFAGDALSRYGSLLAAALGVRMAAAPEILWAPRPAVVASIGARMLARGEVADLDALEPLYVRPSEAERKLMGKVGRGSNRDQKDERK